MSDYGSNQSDKVSLYLFRRLLIFFKPLSVRCAVTLALVDCFVSGAI